MDPSTYIEEENGILLTTLVHIRVALGIWEELDTQLDKQIKKGNLDTKTPWKRECRTNTLLETKTSYRRVIDPKILTWSESDFRGWTKLYFDIHILGL